MQEEWEAGSWLPISHLAESMLPHCSCIYPLIISPHTPDRHEGWRGGQTLQRHQLEPHRDTTSPFHTSSFWGPGDPRQDK